MREDRLASLSLMHMNYDIPIDVNEIVERFVKKNPFMYCTLNNSPIATCFMYTVIL